jgi:hypothetical protein
MRHPSPGQSVPGPACGGAEELAGSLGSAIPPEEFGTVSSQISQPLPIFADEKAESHASASISPLASNMKCRESLSQFILTVVPAFPKFLPLPALSAFLFAVLALRRKEPSEEILRNLRPSRYDSLDQTQKS